MEVNTIPELLAAITAVATTEILLPAIAVTIGILAAKEIERRREEKRKNPPT